MKYTIDKMKINNFKNYDRSPHHHHPNLCYHHRLHLHPLLLPLHLNPLLLIIVLRCSNFHHQVSISFQIHSEFDAFDHAARKQHLLLPAHHWISLLFLLFFIGFWTYRLLLTALVFSVNLSGCTCPAHALNSQYW